VIPFLLMNILLSEVSWLVSISNSFILLSDRFTSVIFGILLINSTDSIALDLRSKCYSNLMAFMPHCISGTSINFILLNDISISTSLVSFSKVNCLIKLNEHLNTCKLGNELIKSEHWEILLLDKSSLISASVNYVHLVIYLICNHR
jgi:hypothetical protein